MSLATFVEKITALGRTLEYPLNGKNRRLVLREVRKVLAAFEGGK